MPEEHKVAPELEDHEITSEELNAFLDMLPKEGEENSEPEDKALEAPNPEAQGEATRIDEQASENNSEGESIQDDTRPLNERLAEIDSKRVKEDTESPRTKLKQYDNFIAEQERHLSAFVSSFDFPQSGVFNHNGKLVYDMSEGELSDYVQNLNDDGKAYAAAQVTKAIQDFQTAARQYGAASNQLQQYKTQRDLMKTTIEWNEVQSEIQSILPEITGDDFTKAADYLRSFNSDPTFQADVSTKAGKLQKGIEALEQLGILERLRKQATPETNKVTSAPPDAQARSKKVTTNLSGDLTNKAKTVSSMRQEQFNKLSESDIDALLGAGLE